MSKTRTSYVCSRCRASVPKWQGQCPECGEWNTLEPVSRPPARATAGGYAGEIRGRRLAEISEKPMQRVPTGIGEFDRVLGGGLVPGAAVLIGGDPGIGKSTLLLQACARLPGEPLYVSGEESLQQISLRARRLGMDLGRITVLAETRVEGIVTFAERERPACIVIDSVQTVHTEQLTSLPGSVNQLRECTAQLVRMAKQTGIPVLLVGHVTRAGNIAGPRVLEHMVDAVLYFENESTSRYRILRAVKNRFGAANELGVFMMLETGMREVRNPSAIFLSRYEQPVAGSVVTAVFQGSRPLLVEVQALTDQGSASPRRVALGLDQNRLVLLLAVLHRHAGVSTHDQDVFVNVVGGVRITGTSADLAALMAVLSSMSGKPVPGGLLVFGEAGLAGEVRPVGYGEERLREAAKLGFTDAIMPRANRPTRPVDGLRCHPVDTVAQAFDALAQLQT